MMDLGNLKVKSLSEILSSLVDYTSMHTDEITDFTEGSIIRSIYEAFAMVLEQLYQLSTENVTWAIDHAILDAFDFSPREAQNAYGEVTVDLFTPTMEDITLGRGTTVFSTDAGNQTKYFQTIQSYLVPQGSTSFKIEVYCTEPGEAGNIPANYIDTVSASQFSIMSATNEDAFLTGRDEESASELKNRFRDFVATRGRGTPRAVNYAVMSVPEITGCYIDENKGIYEVYAHDANGDLPDDVLTKVLNAVERYRPVGVEYHIYPMKKIKVSLQVNIAVTNVDLVTDSFTDALRTYITDYLNHFKADDDLIATEVAHKIIGYSSIITDVQFVGGATYTTSSEELIRSGNIYITVSDKPNFNGVNEIPKDSIDDTDEPTTPPTPDISDGGKVMLGFVYYDTSYNYSRTTNSNTPVSIVYYDKDHSIITTLPYDIGFDVNSKDVQVQGNTYTLLDSQNIPIRSLSYDNNGSTYTTYDEKGSILTQTHYDNYGRVDKLV